MADEDLIRGLQRKLDELAREVASAEAKAARARTKHQSIAATLRALSVNEDDEALTDALEARFSAGANGKKHDVTPRIVALVAKHPGLTAPEITDRLEHVIVTARRDPRRAIVVRIHEMVKQGKLNRDAAGHISLPANANGSHRRNGTREKAKRPEG